MSTRKLFIHLFKNVYLKDQITPYAFSLILKTNPLTATSISCPV